MPHSPLTERLRSLVATAAELGIGDVIELVPQAVDPKDLFGVLHLENSAPSRTLDLHPSPVD